MRRCAPTPPKEHNRSLKAASARKTTQRLTNNRIEHARRNVTRVGSGIQEGSHVRLSEYGATRSDGIGAPCLGGKAVHIGSANAQHSRHGIDKATRASSAGGVHPLLKTVFQVHDLCIFSTQFHNSVCIRMQRSHRICYGNNLLDVGSAERFGKRDARRPGKRNRTADIPFFLDHLAQNARKRRSDIGKMAAVRGAQDGALLVDNDYLDRLGPGIYADANAH